MKENNDDEIDETLELKQLSFKKSLSLPPPGLIQGCNKEDYKNVLEYNEYLKKIKIYNPRYANDVVLHDNEFREKSQIISKPINQNNNKINNFCSEKKEKKKILNLNSPSFTTNLIEDKLLKEDPFILSPQMKIKSIENVNVPFVRKWKDVPQDNEINKFAYSKSQQHDYEFGDKIKKTEIFEECNRFIYDLVKDNYYNYIIQKILEIGEPEHKIGLFEKIKDILYELQQDKFGCRIFQKCLEAFRDPTCNQFIFMFGKIREYINDLLISENGNFVIQKCLEIYEHQYFKFILDLINQNLKQMCCHKYGCLIIQKLIDVHIERENTFKEETNKTILTIIDNSEELSKKEYSNYVIQHILENGKPDHKERLLNLHIKPNFIDLSCDQFASNVAEKSIIFSDAHFRKKIWNIIKKLKDKTKFIFLINNKYGNYVVQRIFEYSDHDIKKEIFQMVYENSSNLTTEGHYVFKFMQKFY